MLYDDNVKVWFLVPVKAPPLYFLFPSFDLFGMQVRPYGSEISVFQCLVSDGDEQQMFRVEYEQQ